MSDSIKHECGVALIRLLKPFPYYVKKYGTPFYALNKLYIMMEKQSNRGQDGAGVAVIKMDVNPGYRYISRYRSVDPYPTGHIFRKIHKKVRKSIKDHKKEAQDPEWLKQNVAFMGEVLIGHLRYGTHGLNSIENCHPFLRQNNWRSRNLVMAGNFNMTNVDDLFDKLIELGQHPKEKADTVTVLEKIGHFMDEEIQVMFNRLKDRFSNAEISAIIENSLDIQRVLKRSCKDFDGGYTMVGATGYGGSFVARDPNGIRPAYYYANDEILVAASERPAIRLAFGAEYEDIKEIKPGHALIINKEGEFDEYQFREPQEKLSCSFERIYFSRGSDPKIYQERKMLGKLLCPQILEAVNYDLENTVFSFIPNTAETAFLGMIDGLNEHVANFIREEISKGKLKKERIDHLLTLRPRIEKIVIKDAKLRTFITDDSNRNEMVSQVYDTTSDSIKKGVDTLVILDDSIVRGTTLERSILRILDKIGPKKIIIVSSAPQIRYPDCYGIDMSKVKDFVAFRAMLELLKDKNLEHMLDDVYDKCKATLADDYFDEPKNYVKELFDMFSEDEISLKVSEIVKPKDLHADVEVIYQRVENLHKACPDHLGDWYFTGKYPTPGGNKIVNKSFVNFMEGKLVRAY